MPKGGVPRYELRKRKRSGVWHVLHPLHRPFSLCNEDLDHFEDFRLGVRVEDMDKIRLREKVCEKCYQWLKPNHQTASRRVEG